MIKVSVIIPIYNSEKYLEDMLSSVIHQTLREIEIICINDMSSDNSLGILNKYIELDKRIKVINNVTTLGPGYARNIGLKYAVGEYISFLDSDDLIEADMLEKVYNECVENELDIGIFKADCFDNATGKLMRNYSISCLTPQVVFNYNDVSKYLYTLFYGWAWDKLFKRSFIEMNELSFSDYKVGEDMCFTYIALSVANRIKFIRSKKAFYHYRKNTQTSLTDTAQNNLEHSYYILKHIKADLIRRGIYSELKYNFINLSLSFLIIIFSRLRSNRKEFYDKMKNVYFKELGINNEKPSYFYNRYNYYRYKLIMENEFSDELYRKHFYGFIISDLYHANVENLDKLFNYFKLKNMKVGVLEEYQNGFEVETIKYCKDNAIDIFPNECADIVIVSNSSWYEKALSMFNSKVFDLDAYFKFSPEIEECIGECKKSEKQ